MLTPKTILTEQQSNDYIQKMYRIVGLGMKVYNELGFGYSEPIYQECLSIMCDENGIPWEREKPLKMMFHDKQLKKEYVADFVCFGDIIVELKAVSSIIGDHRAQLFNYLRITGLHAGILMNFGEEDRLHSERYLYNPHTNKYDLVSGDGTPKPKYYPGSNIPYSSL